MTGDDSSIPFLDHVRDSAPPSLVPLSDVPWGTVADDASDIRGWRVRTRAGGDIGEVTDLIVDATRLQVRYLDVRLERAVADGCRHVLVPIGVAQLDERRDDVHVDTGAASLLGAPAYVRDAMSPDYERTVLECYGWRGRPATAERTHEFYRGPYFDERSFFAARRGRTERSSISSVSRSILREWERCVGCTERAGPA